jgi:predicted transcriptional regulator YdeE
MRDSTKEQLNYVIKRLTEIVENCDEHYRTIDINIQMYSVWTADGRGPEIIYTVEEPVRLGDNKNEF